MFRTRTGARIKRKDKRGGGKKKTGRETRSKLGETYTKTRKKTKVDPTWGENAEADTRKKNISQELKPTAAGGTTQT